MRYSTFEVKSDPREESTSKKKPSDGSDDQSRRLNLCRLLALVISAADA
jgi:hypothetical protein